MYSKDYVCLGAVLTVSTVIFLVTCWGRKPTLFPPGPRGLFWLGNTLQIPKDQQWLTFSKWAEEYGSVMRITVLGQPHVVLSSLEAVEDLFESRGNVYSDRPPAVMAGELVGWDRGLGYTNHNARFGEFRRLFHTYIGPRACSIEQFQRQQEIGCLTLVQKLLDSPEHFFEHVRDETSGSMLQMLYGYSVTSSDPLHLVKIVEDAMNGFSVASEPGKWWVDSFPLLKYLPESLASFQRVARNMRNDLNKMYDVPYAFVKTQIDEGIAMPSFIRDYLQDREISDRKEMSLDEEIFIKGAAGSLYSGGAETTVSSINSFILAMVLNPSIQEHAHQELACSLQPLRLPLISDRPNLPYISAIVQEIWRWNPSVPLALPHMASADDEYKGMKIEKGSTVWANVWGILHDEAAFPDPFEFRPERYLGDGENKRRAREAVKVAFGLGRRICPGMYLAENTVFVTVAVLLQVFSFKPAGGEPITIRHTGFISHPEPFRCKIEPRSPEAVTLVQEALATH